VFQVGRGKFGLGKCETSGGQTFRLPAPSAARRTQEPWSSSREQFLAGAGTNQEHNHPGCFRSALRASFA
jgi:hypothetical protein